MANVVDRAREGEEPGRLGLPFWQLWSASSLSNLADGLVKVALPLVAVTLTDSPGLVAGVTLAVTLPWLLFALPAGALADRVDRRIAMVTANVVRATGVAVLAVTVLLGLESSPAAIWALYAVALLLGTAETIYDTCAQSILPQVVARDQLPRANGRLIAAELTANEFVGPPLGGLLVAAGVAVAFATPAALWAAAVGALLLLRGGFSVSRREPTTLRADVVEGLRYLWRHRLLRTLAAMTGLFNFATNATFAVFVLYAVGPDSAMGLTEVSYGLLFATIAAGSLIGALLADRIIRRLGRSRSLFLGILGGVGTVGIAAVTTIPLVIATAFLIGGLTNALWNVVAVSLRQRITPDRILGRINSSYRLVAWGTRPLGAAAAGGLLGELVGLRAVFGIAAGLILATLIGMTQITDSAISIAEHDAADIDGTVDMPDSG
jgi:MFS family permease